MPTPDWETIKQLAGDALELPPQARGEFVARACGDDAALRAEVEALLGHDEDFLETPAITDLDVARTAPIPIEPGATLGRYRLERVIGEGGMGRVFEATQEQPRRTVALKILRPGFFAADATRRFEWEVEALARLDHPAVAKVFEAGTTMLDAHTAVPWFAMELVDGRPLLRAADQLDLDRRGRLRLFIRMCEGVAHAHARGIIHRDLKPDNVLVDASGQPRILDFGIARPTDDDSQLTADGQVLGTPEYMAPEQLTGDPAAIDVRADVHALGNLLYRLLTGRAPFDLQGLTITQVALRLSRDDAAPASRHDRSLAGDLDTILSTALARDPTERYASVEQFADDVRRHLDDLPIAARPPSTIYQLRKFARRHRGLAAGLLSSLLLLIVAVVGITIGWLRTDAALEVAALERDRYRASTRLLSRMLESADPDVDGRDARVVDLLDTAGAELAASRTLDPGVRAAMHLTLGRSYQKLGLGETAETQLRSAIRLADETDGPTSELALDARAALSELLYGLGRIDAGMTLEREFSAALENLEDPVPWMVARPLELAALRFEVLGDAEASSSHYRRLAKHWEQHRSTDPDAHETALNNLGVTLLARGDLAEAEQLLREAIELRSARLGADHPSLLTQRANLAALLADLGRQQDAAAIFADVVPRIRAVFGDNHRSALSVRNNEAATLGAMGLREEAHERYRQLLSAHEKRYGPDHRETWVARNNLAVSAMELDELDLAERELRALLDSMARSPQPADPLFETRARLNLAAALDRLDRREEALPLSGAGLARLEELAGSAAMPTLIARNNHALLLSSVGGHAEALRLARRNLELATEHYPDHPINVFPLENNLARVLSAAGEHDEALRRFRDVERRLLEAGEARTADLRRCRELLEQAEAAARDG